MSTSLQKFDFSVPLGSLDSFIHWANKVPLLTAEQEHALATEYQETGNLDAARQLVMSHLRFVISTARGYNGYGLAQGDLIQEGNIGLMKAVKRFDPNMGVRLVSYAVHWIKAEIHEFILKNWRIVKIATTKAQRKLFFNLRKSTEKITGWLKDKDISSVAKALNVETKDVKKMEMSLHARDQAFETNDDNDDDWHAPANYLEDSRFDPARMTESSDWTDQRQHALTDALKTLDDRSVTILQKRWLADQKSTLHDLADEFGVSAERIRQLEQNAFKKIRLVIDA